MKALRNTLLLLLATFGLTSCGGGGGGSNSVFTPPGADSISISAAPPSIGTFSFTAITVTVQKNDGSSEDDGTQVSAALSPTTIGTVAASQGQGGGATATNTLAGGKATFYFNSSNQGGTATISFSLPAGLHGNPNSASKSIGITVTPGNVQDPRLQLTPSTTTLPVSPYTVGQEQDVTLGFPGNYLGSPYISEVTVTFRHSNGQLVNGSVTANVSVQPVGTLSYSTLVGSTTTTGPDQFHTLLGSGQVTITAGVGTIFVHAGQQTGTGVLTVTAIDPDSGQTITSQLEITVGGGSSGLPTSVSITASGGNVYVTNSGGAQSTIVSAVVTDGSNSFVSAPAGVNNVQFQIVGPAGTDARLATTNAAGQQVSGTTVATTTRNGVASVTFLAGLEQGPVQVKVTADRGDNNVDNGIQDPVSATSTVVVSDGKLFSLKITNPAIDPNLLPVIGDASSTGGSTPTPVYTVPVTVLATDRQGKAVLAGTSIQFGLIDAPVFGYPDQGSGTFEIAGNDGNPQEGGTLFTAPSGQFLTAGGGAGPGDALVVFGKETTGDSDLESARTVQRVNTQGSLNVTQAFNLNAIDTGSVVDTGNNIPYVIGRATAGNIDAQAFTGLDASGLPDGIASVNMRYPQSRIGQSAVVWAQGTGAQQSNGVPRTVADAVRTRYLGVGPAVLFAEPTTIFGNTTQSVSACLVDAVGSPIPGVTLSFSFSGLSGGAGTVNGKAGGTLTPATGADGCVDTTVVTSGVQPGSAAKLTFTVAGLSAPVTITVGEPVLTANPTHITSLSGTKPQNNNVALTLSDGLGNPISGATITGTCAPAGTSITTTSPLVTGSNGGATTTITTLGFCVAAAPAPNSVCTYTYTSGSSSATALVNVAGTVGGGAVSPPVVCSNLP